AEVSDLTRSRGKLAPNWEGPYQIASIPREGPYRKAVAKNVAHLKFAKVLHVMNHSRLNKKDYCH
ncbi:hypothetical protein BHE74_00039614, partial [Ensete ventricosum]